MVDGDANQSSDDTNGSSNSSGSDSWIKPDQSEEQDWSADKKSFDTFGWNEWIRAIFFAHFISDFPTAISWTRVRNGNIYGANTFKWLARWYSHIGGWVASVANLTLAGILLAKGIDEY